MFVTAELTVQVVDGYVFGAINKEGLDLITHEGETRTVAHEHRSILIGSTTLPKSHCVSCLRFTNLSSFSNSTTFRHLSPWWLLPLHLNVNSFSFAPITLGFPQEQMAEHSEHCGGSSCPNGCTLGLPQMNSWATTPSLVADR
jgi:hypothetical protein